MPTAPKRKPSVLKRARQAEKSNLRNKTVRTRVKTLVKKVLDAVSSKDNTQAEAALREAMKVVGSAASKGVLKKASASRKISRLAKKVNKVSKPAAA